MFSICRQSQQQQQLYKFIYINWGEPRSQVLLLPTLAAWQNMLGVEPDLEQKSPKMQIRLLKGEVFDASQYAFFGKGVANKVELGGLEDEDDCMPVVEFNGEGFFLSREEIKANENYVDSGSPFLILLHPALGPLREVTRQKDY